MPETLEELTRCWSWSPSAVSFTSTESVRDIVERLGVRELGIPHDTGSRVHPARCQWRAREAVAADTK